MTHHDGLSNETVKKVLEGSVGMTVICVVSVMDTEHAGLRAGACTT